MVCVSAHNISHASKLLLIQSTDTCGAGALQAQGFYAGMEPLLGPLCRLCTQPHSVTADCKQAHDESSLHCRPADDLLLELLVGLPHRRQREMLPHDALLLLTEPRRERHRVRDVQVPLVLLRSGFG